MDKLKSDFRGEICDHLETLSTLENSLSSSLDPGSGQIQAVRKQLKDLSSNLDGESEAGGQDKRVKLWRLKMQEIRQTLRTSFPECAKFAFNVRKDSLCGDGSNLPADYDEDDDDWSETSADSGCYVGGGGMVITITKQDESDPSGEPACFPGINIGQSNSGLLNPFYIPKTGL